MKKAKACKELVEVLADIYRIDTTTQQERAQLDKHTDEIIVTISENGRARRYYTELYTTRKCRR